MKIKFLNNLLAKRFTLNANSSSGFTLVELLIVITIIGILVSFLAVNFFGVRQRSKDAQRKSDLQLLQSALEQYRADNNSYVDKTTFDAISCGAAFTGTGGTIYMQKLPCDPDSTSTTSKKYYYFRASSFTYVLASCIDNAQDAAAVSVSPSYWPSGAAWPPLTCSSGKYYILQNP